MVKISKEALAAYNNRMELSANENYNKAQGWGTQAENAVLRIIGNHLNGMFFKALTAGKVKKWLSESWNVEEAESAMAFWALRTQ